MAHITFGNLESANADLFFENPESFITELGADETGKIQGGLLDNISLLNGNTVGVAAPINLLGNQGGDNDGIDNKVTYPVRY
ncbi:MAG: hypothetical protein KME49_10920 [Brasilonema octagenarum HA4186-MV1]|jgi:hypothetical protein|uniref:Uncharacterized protein n=2 Tax=Brasilonema TaxID=383614 RepID=A0A856M9A6_9CYAN|nr:MULTISPECIES: hypothetical protein [Brasilonema]MBW4625989.1 hypothetical protein [Brasilonema octagenarum HA4186-MV1]NMF62016.1 hypothetical protein [Brasilonema octagenarum UFV-OR1]QDL07302.1 hypothetical protein DP114_04725 [Brasilonema sennae CENA114]QDL13666.1 hypothetical protein DP113_04675 [Brasilonema octagenarum UFV-E1]